MVEMAKPELLLRTELCGAAIGRSFLGDRWRLNPGLPSHDVIKKILRMNIRKIICVLIFSDNPSRKH
jgi:hypothetical protein